MKKLYQYSACLMLLGACSENKISESKPETINQPPVGKEVYKTYQITLDKDTINRVDFNDKKQGLWIIYKPLNITEPLTKLEEGEYKNDKKTGYWKHYNSDGTFKDSVLMKE